MPREGDDNEDQREYLLVRGRLTRDDDFTPRRCGSTTFVRNWPEPEQHDHGDVIAETLDAEGRVLRTQRPRIEREGVCAPEVQTWRVRVYVPLDDEAAELRLRRGDRLLWSTPIGEPPMVGVKVLSPPTRGKSDRERDESGFPGGEPAVLGLDVSRPTDPDVAYVKVVYRWAERGFHTVYLGPTRRRISIDPDRLPGGARCEFFVVYSDGLRSAAARTKPIKVEPIGPVLTIMRPEGGSTFPEGAPVDVECLVQHPESPDVLAEAEERTAWLVDGEPIATGTLTSIGPLAAGTHRIEVRLSAGGRRADVETGVDITVRKARAALADDWPEHDPFAD
ncbi:MAG: hypothetical protein ABIP17_01385 [Ilumatobacteraceae bacterium]